MSKTNNYNYVSACSDIAASASRYTLLNRQEPIHARISTNNERDRRPIDPPPIIQIRLNNATPQQTDTFHQTSYFYMCANLAHPTDDQEIYTPTHNALSGQTVSSMYKLKDIDNHDGAFFIFGDLSVKVEGHFRLKLSLFEITSTGAVCLQSIFTAPFVVYPAKKFPGMLDSTFLSRSFSDQGARIRIRKENRAQPSNTTAALNTTLASSQQPRNNMVARKRKLEIQTEPSLLRTARQPIQAYNTTSPMMSHHTERRASITSSGTESSSEGNSSPITAPFGSPRGLSLPPLSPPQQSYDKLFGASYCMYSSMSPTSSPPSHILDPSVKLPPIRHVLHQKRQKLARSEEEDAVLAMMQLSHHY